MGLFSKPSQKKTVMYKKVEPEPLPIPIPTTTLPTTTVREKIHKVRWTIRNLKALEKTGTKEIRSPRCSVYSKTADRHGDHKLHVHRYVVCTMYIGRYESYMHAIYLYTYWFSI